MKNHIHKCLLIFLALFAWANSGLCADDEKDFKPLFNGKDLTGWHFSAATGVSFRGWQVVNGILENKVRRSDRVMDLISDLKFWNFVLRLEYKIPTRSNSGVFLRDLHEIQIFGDYDMREVNTICNGAIYNFAAPKEFASKPSGEWQHLEVTMVEQEITVILNEKKDSRPSEMLRRHARQECSRYISTWSHPTSRHTRLDQFPKHPNQGDSEMTQVMANTALQRTPSLSLSLWSATSTHSL